MVQYQYTPLGDGQIRLLEIAPGNPEDAIRCKLLHCQLAEGLEYCALSYHWGPAVFDQEIYISSCDQNTSSSSLQTSLAVTSTLHEALQKVRQTDSAFLLWADAVCINQSDLQERNAQLRLMRQIYQNAELILIYLGGESENSNLVPYLIQQLVKRRDAPPDDRWPVVATEIRDGELSLTNPAWRALNAIFRRPWFRRVWVIQEAALARQAYLFCGSWSLGFDTFERAYRMGMYQVQENDEQVQKETIVGRQCFTTICNIRKSIRDGYQPALLGLVYVARRAWSSHPADYLYGVLGICAEGEEPDLQPNYAESVTETLRRYSNHFAFSRQVYSLLEFAHISAWEEGQPSWYPNWASHRSTEHWLYQSTGQEYYEFEAGGTLPNRIEMVDDVENNLHLLKIRGFLVDVIGKLGDDKRAASNQIGGAYAHDIPKQLIRGWFDEMDDLGPQWYDTPAELFEAKWQTLVTGAIAPEPYNFVDGYNILMNDIPRPPDGEIGPDGKSAQAHHDISLCSYVGKMNTTIPDLTLSRTELGMLGMVPYGTVPGDLIVVFLGLQVPFVLRPTREGEMGYRIVGSCYVHGVMRGEALRNIASSEDEQLHDFIIV